jgi:hypothetical protein
MADMSGALLLRHGLVTQAQISQATAVQRKDGGSFGECLVRIGAVDEEQLVEFYHKRLMIPRIADAKLFIVSPKVLSLVPADMAAEFRAVPVEVDNEGTITLAMSDPTNNHAVDEIAFFADRFVLRAAGTESAVRRAIETHYGVRFTSPRASDRVISTAPQLDSVRISKPQPAAGKTQPHKALKQKPQAPPHEDLSRTIPSPPPAPAAAHTPPVQSKAALHEPEPKPTKEQLDQQIVLLTRVKRSEETPLPMPVPPPADYTPEYPREEPTEPILLTQPKERERRDTLPGVTLPVPDPPLQQLRAARERDEIAQITLDYVAQMAQRALFFVIRKNLLVGHDGRGATVDPEAVQQLAVNIEVPSIFRDVIASRLPYRGPLPETSVNRAFAQSIGGVGWEVLLMPITIRDRIIAVLFADQAMMPLPDAALHATTREAGLAYERLILETKGR